MHAPTVSQYLIGKQATKGVGSLYDSIETLFAEVVECLERIKIHLAPPPTPHAALIVDALVQVLIVCGIATKYCGRAALSTHTFKDKDKGFSWRRSAWNSILSQRLLIA